KHDLNLATEQVGKRGPPTAIGNMNHVDTSHHLEQFARDMLRPSDAPRCKVNLARIGFGIGDEFRNGVGRNSWMHYHHVGHKNNAGGRRDLTDEIVVERIVKRRVDGVCRRDEEQRVSVWDCLHDRFGTYVTASARPILNDEWLAEALRQPLPD